MNNNEELSECNFAQLIHACFGHLIKKIRLISPLSHNEMQMISSINSSTEQRLENQQNFSIHSYVEAMFHHLKSIKCDLNIFHLCVQITQALHSGKCLIICAVDSSEIGNYNPRQIILYQQSDDKEELERRNKRYIKILQIARKISENRQKEESTKRSKRRKK